MLYLPSDLTMERNEKIQRKCILSYVYNIPKLIMFNPFLFATYYQYYQFHIFVSTFYKISTKIIPERMGVEKKKLQRVKFLILHVQGTYFKNVS